MPPEPRAAPPAPPSPAAAATLPPEEARRYWRRNLLYLAVLLSIWALVSFGFGVVWADRLNGMRLPGTGFPLGFWFAQQGAIYTFLLLIVAYVALMNGLDRRHGVRED